MQQPVVQAPDPMMLAQALKAPSGSQQWLAEHQARATPPGDFNQLDQSLGGQYSKGNIDLNGRTPYIWRNPDGTPTQNYSSLESMSTNIGGKEVLFPKITPDGKLLTDEQAIQQYMQTGQHLGKFDSPEEATKHALALEKRQGAYYQNGPGKYILNKIYGR